MFKLLVTDIDGVLTDGRIYVDKDGEERKSLCLRDLDARGELRKAGVCFGIITGEQNAFTKYVKERFQPDYFEEGCKEKRSALMSMQQCMGITSDEICYLGDGKYDLEAIACAGLGVCPSDAAGPVKRCADLVLNCPGGNGCLSACCDIVLEREGRKACPTECLESNAKANRYGSLVRSALKEHNRVSLQTAQDKYLQDQILKAAELISASLQKGGQLLLCGNGGSAADAQHLATELVSRFYLERSALNAEALTTNTSTLTAVGNDYHFDKIFARQVEAKGRKGDVLIGISTSGNSGNILQAFFAAHEIGMLCIALTGADKTSRLSKEADLVLSVPCEQTPRIQEMHILIGHILCEAVERTLCGKEETTDEL